MRNLLVFLHLAAAIFWMGGMAFMLFALRPAAHAQLQPPLRLQLLAEVLRRFFALVVLSIVVLLATGAPMLLQASGALVNPWSRRHRERRIAKASRNGLREKDVTLGIATALLIFFVSRWAAQPAWVPAFTGLGAPGAAFRRIPDRRRKP